MVLPEVSVCYLLRETHSGHEVLLGRKKTGLGLGNLVGPGGKLEAGESPTDAAVRETREEVGVTVHPDSLTLIGELTYPFPHRPAWSQKSWAFLCREFSGEPVESDELRPEWFPLDDLPLDRMWDDAKHWLPSALAGRFVRATFTFAADGKSVESSDFVRTAAS
ncbi:MAG: 8-oxo-dGTP diphosphatase [Microbacteriaceae bacterium]|nr:8-oxo-dGTP diphosphatase [Microbacteriaceae bacterium]